MSDVVDMNCLELTTTEIFLRYFGECEPLKGKAKGGYFVGRVKVPFNDKKKEEIFMTIDLVPSADLVETIVKTLHKKVYPDLSPENARAVAEPLAMAFPNLIHHLRFEDDGKRACEKEPVISNYSWKLEYIIDDKKVIRKKTCKQCMKCRKCILDADRPEVWKEKNQEVGTLLEEKVEGKKAYFFQLTENQGKNKAKKEQKFCVKPFQALKNGNADLETTIDAVLNDRLSDQTQKVRDIIKSFYSKNNIQNIWMFRLRVQFKDEAGSLKGEGISGDIKDTKNIKSGSMDILDVIVSKSCYTGRRKICILSEWDLDKKKDVVQPKLKVYNDIGTHLEELTKTLNQPDEVIVEKRSVRFLSPRQNGDKIKDIYNKGHTIKLLLQRLNGQESNKAVTFKYIPCDGSCDFCKRDVENVDGDCLEEGEKLKTGERANPGHHRRTINNYDIKRPKNETKRLKTETKRPKPETKRPKPETKRPKTETKIDPIVKESDGGMRDDASAGPSTSSCSSSARVLNSTNASASSQIVKFARLQQNPSIQTQVSSGYPPTLPSHYINVGITRATGGIFQL